MKVRVRKLDATDTEPERLRVRPEEGDEREFPYPHGEGLTGRGACVWAIRRMFRGPQFTITWLGDSGGVTRFEVQELSKADLENIKREARMGELHASMRAKRK